MKTVSIFGSTGSIGRTTLSVIAAHPTLFKVHALTCNENIDLLKEQVAQFLPKVVVVANEKRANELKGKLGSTKVLAGIEGLEELASDQEGDIALMALVGVNALLPTVRAIEKGKRIALASKEVVVAGGAWLMEQVKKWAHLGAQVIPVDSEHSALFQCLKGEKKEHVSKLILTSSGGPFRTWDLSRFASIGIKEALAHPTWNMGKKVTIDSSTLMNKALEMIEARHLFGIDKIEVVIHPQSAVHSLVEFIDGSITALISEPHMSFPIQYALTAPDRAPSIRPPFDFERYSKLEFQKPDRKKFPTIGFAEEALRAGLSVPCFLNAANDVLVDRFLKQEISWVGIIERLEKLLAAHVMCPVDGIEKIVNVDMLAREEAKHS